MASDMPDFAPSQQAATDVPEDAPLGGALMANTLAEYGIDTVFALCGGHILPLFDACRDAGIRIVDHRHEGAAALAAEGYALATGKTGFAAVTAGGGFANAVIGLTDAGTWSVPMVLFAGHAPLAQAGRGAVQDAPQLAMASPVAKKALSCFDAAKIPRVTAEAIYLARAGRTGPVYLEVPQDVLAAKAVAPSFEYPVGYPKTPPTPAGAPEDVERALAALENAERPIILCGSGAFWSGAGEEIARLAQRGNIPITTSSAARGVVPDSHPLCLGGLVHAGIALLSSDVVMILGSAFNANICFGREPLFQPGQTIIQVDIAAEGIGGDRRPEIAVVGDVGRVAKALADGWKKDVSARAAWVAEAREMAAAMLGTWDSQIDQHSGSRVHAGAAARAVTRWARQRFGGKVTLVGDGGDAMVWLLAYGFAEGPGRLMTTTTALGTLGVGLPFALGAKAARPDEPVVLFAGDGAFGFTAMELESTARQNLPIVCVVSNNYGWRDVSHEQDMWFGKGRRFSTELSDCRYDKLAEALGGHGEHVKKLDGLVPALDRALESGKTSVVNVETDPEVLSELLKNLGSMGIN
jgi:thiamine pyrophosphate-dependent acetolactate synthase large subunit-like protein